MYPHCARAAFGTLTVSAFGYPAQRTSFARSKVAEILRKDNPEFMFILYGTNNNKAEKHIGAAMDDLAAVVKALEWLREVDGQLYRNNRHRSGREAWVAVVRTPQASGRRGKLIVALGSSREEAATAAAGQWHAVWRSFGPAH